MISQGWICPRCGTIWAPDFQNCPECHPPAVLAQLSLERVCCCDSITFRMNQMRQAPDVCPVHGKEKE